MSGQLRNTSPERFDYAKGICSGGGSDIDLIIERRGHFLVVENKRPGEAISRGQMIMLRSLNELPQFTVIIVRGEPPDQIISAGPLDGEQYPMNVQQFRNWMQRWWNRHETSVSTRRLTSHRRNGAALKAPLADA